MKNKEYNLPIIISLVLTLTASGICLIFSIPCAVICLIAGAIVCTVFVLNTKKRFEEINELNRYLEMVCAGNYDLDVDSNREGELSILKNNIYKVILLLRFSNEALKKDKTHLADSLADISHQLKTPLTSVMVMTDLINEESNIGKIKDFAKIIENQTDKMKWLIATLLKLSKLDADTVEFKSDTVPIREILSESVKPFMLMLDLKGIALETNIKDFDLSGDRNWSIEAFANIIKNCIEHTGQDGVISIATGGTALYDEVIIRDNGCGISKDDLPHIFERFYHGKNSDSDSVGIGLAFAKTIFEKEKGVITVQSEEGIGSEFHVKFYKSIV